MRNLFIAALALLAVAGCARVSGGDAPAPIGIPPPTPACEIPPMIFKAVVDNADAGFASESGDWGTCHGGECGGVPFGPDFRYADPGCVTCRARFDFRVDYRCAYDVYAWWPRGDDRATDTPFTLTSGSASSTIHVDQRSSGSAWYRLATLPLQAGESFSVIVSGSKTGFANADAIAITMSGVGPPP